MKYLRTCFVVFCCLMLVGVSLSQEKEEKKDTSAANENSLQKDIEKVKCKNKERLEAVKKLFISKGAKEDEIKITGSKSIKNLSVVKKGVSDETIIIGAHYDELGGGCGVIDNWSGIVIIANLYKRIKAFKTKKTYKFVAFDKEEKGLIGSKKMAGSIPKEERTKYCSMVNFDSFGLSYPQTLKNISSEKLIVLAKDVAKGMKMPFTAVNISGASSDSASFKSKKIPAITVSGLSNNWQKILHTRNDKIEKVNIKSVYYGYLFGLNFIAKLDAAECSAFRKK